MNHLLRTCKCHWAGSEYLHWGGTLRRGPFAQPGTAPQFAPDSPISATQMRVELHLEPEAERAWGNTTHTCLVNAKQVREVRFHARQLEIGRVTVNGRRAEFDNSGEFVTIALARAARRGEKLAIAMDHAVTRPAAGLYFTNPDPDYPQRFRTVWSQGQDEDSRYYFPCLDAPHFKQRTEALLHVPRGWFALSNGHLVRHKARSSATEDLWHYRMELPYSTYLFSVVAGEFVLHKERWKDVEVRWYVQKGREREGRNAFGNTADILRFLSEFTGVHYPYRQYTQIAVPDFIFGGMENFTVTTQTDVTLHDDRAHLDFSSDDLVAHEAAHSWFGNLVTARSWAHAWLHESFATYLEALYLRDSEGQDEFDYQMLTDAETYFNEDTRYRRPLVTHRFEAPIDLFDAHLYPGGAVRLRHLHALLGDDAFRAVLQRYLEQYRCGVAETVDLARVVEAVTGSNYDWWFHQWIFSAGYPALEVSYTWKEEERMAELVIRQTQPYDDGTPEEKHRPYFRLPLRVAFHTGRKAQVFALRVQGAETRALFPLPQKPTLVLLDPDAECPVKRVKFEKPQDLLLRQLRAAENVIARIEAANSLAEKPSAAVTQALARRLKAEKFWGVQQRIARALGKIGGAAARNALIAALALPHPKARRAVVEALGYFKDDPAAAAALTRKAKQGDESYYVEAELARALGRCRAPKALELLREFVQRDSHAEVIRQGAYDGMAALAQPEVLGSLEAGARYGAPSLARPAAIRATGELGKRDLSLRAKTLELLQTAAEHRDNPAGSFRAKMAALRALESMGDLDGLPILARVAEREADGRLVRLARTVRNSLREGAAKPAEMVALRSDVDTVVKENKSLRDRLEALDQKQAAAKTRGRGRRAAPAKQGHSKRSG
jgi:aminopeptidase N